MKLVALDSETHLMQTGCVIPKPVCFQFATRDDDEEVDVEVILASDPRALGILEGCLADPEIHLTGANTAYDMAVAMVYWPHLTTAIFDAYEAGRIHDVQLMDKLLIISSTGDLEFYTLPDGSKGKLGFAQDDLERRWLGVDRGEEKKGEDAWRLRYGELEGVPVDEWPAEALRYAREDPVGALLLHERIVLEANDEGWRSIKTEAFQAAASFALFLGTAWGMEVDPERVERLAEKLDELIGPEMMKPLYEAGLLTPLEPSRPHQRKKKDGSILIIKDKETGLPKMTKEKPEKRNDGAIREYIVNACTHYGIQVKYTDPSDKHPKGQVKKDADTLRVIADHGDPLMKLLADREEIVKLRSSFLPVLRNEVGVVHFGFNALVTSGRTSSFGSDAYASTNGQNLPRVDGDLSIRECHVPRPGMLFCSTDYSALELCSVGQVTHWLFPDQSMHRKRINDGYDLHAYLGSRLAATMDPDFMKVVAERGLDAEQAYQAFLQWKGHEEEELAKLFKHFRRFAKPTGLGYPGGLGPDTFIEFARATYGVIVDKPTAELLRNVWFKTYPEMRRYFDWINGQADPHNVGRYAYKTPMGMYRAGCKFTEAANGMAMQSPSAEGAKIAVFQLTRECYDPSRDSILFGCHMPNFVHDETIVELPDDERAHERAMRIADVMVESMQMIMPDVAIKAEPALMRRWYKQAEPVYVDGRLVPWEPKQ